MLFQFEVPTKVEFAMQIGILEAIGFFTVYLVTPYGELPQIPHAGAGGPGLVGTLPCPRAPSVPKPIDRAATNTVHSFKPGMGFRLPHLLF